ncbi:MAG: FAD-binding oxidoreductase [Nevskia sp.]|nr:FAD-binding oxidoreductase [Nevskia sp.]
MSTPASLRALLGARCIDDPERLRRYEIPERGELGHTRCALLPQTEDELGEVLRACNASGQRLVISAGRTGLVEAQRPDGEAVLSLEKLNRPLRLELADGAHFEFAAAGDPPGWREQLGAWWFDLGRGAPAPGEATITVQAGLAVDALNEVVEPLGLMWPMEMGSSASASVGACVANASAGANAVCYGTAAHMAAAAWGWWGDGSPAGPCAAAPWTPPDPAALAIDSARVRPEWGLVGSQGVLGVIGRAQLRLYPLPAQREAVLLPVSGMPAAMRLLEQAREAFPGEVEEFEFIGRGAVELVRAHLGAAFRWPLEGEPDAPFYILLQVKSQDASEDLAGRLYDFLAVLLEWPAERIGYAPLPLLKKLRHSITESSNARMRALGGGRLSFDTAAPVAVFGNYLAALESEIRAAEPAIGFIAFGHAGVGGAHLHLLGTHERPVSGRAAALIKLVFDVTRHYGGTFSAEHGVGAKWAAEYQQRAPAAQRQALLAEKRRHDPRAILNPRSFGLGAALGS